MGMLLAEVLASKHPNPTPLSVEGFPQYKEMSTLMYIDIIAYILKKLARAMQNAVGMGGIDAIE